ncbi:unnamed protein product [Caenorhabditis brenneri]
MRWLKSRSMWMELTSGRCCRRGFIEKKTSFNSTKGGWNRTSNCHHTEEMMAYGLRMSESGCSPYSKEMIRRMYDDYEVAHPADPSALGFILLQIQLFYEDPNVILMLNSYFLFECGIYPKEPFYL